MLVFHGARIKLMSGRVKCTRSASTAKRREHANVVSEDESLHADGEEDGMDEWNGWMGV